MDDLGGVGKSQAERADGFVGHGVRGPGTTGAPASIARGPNRGCWRGCRARAVLSRRVPDTIRRSRCASQCPASRSPSSWRADGSQRRRGRTTTMPRERSIWLPRNHVVRAGGPGVPGGAAVVGRRRRSTAARRSAAADERGGPGWRPVRPARTASLRDAPHRPLQRARGALHRDGGRDVSPRREGRAAGERVLVCLHRGRAG